MQRLIVIIWTRPEPEHNLWYPARPGPKPEGKARARADL
jgi:hypothetical protein